MIHQTDIGTTRFAQLRALVKLRQSEIITLGGNRPGQIYGRLDCRAGKRMKLQNRVFFRDETDAVRQGFRPCAICLPDAYRMWKQSGSLPSDTLF